MKRIKVLSSILLPILLVSCSVIGNNCICTQEFDGTSVVVVDQNNNPIDSLSYQLIDKFDNTIVTNLVPYDSTTNVYPLLNDSYTPKLSEIPRTFVFEAHKETISIKQDFLFNTDNCGCHINKFAGPDTIVVFRFSKIRT